MFTLYFTLILFLVYSEAIAFRLYLLSFSFLYFPGITKYCLSLSCLSFTYLKWPKRWSPVSTPWLLFFASKCPINQNLHPYWIAVLNLESPIVIHLSVICPWGVSLALHRWNGIYTRGNKRTKTIILWAPTYLITSRQGLTTNSLGLGLRVFHTRVWVCVWERETYINFCKNKKINLIKTKEITLQVKFNLYKIIITEGILIRYFRSCSWWLTFFFGSHFFFWLLTFWR